jgi:hypothetical protein
VQDDSTAVFVRQITMDGKSIGSFKLGLSTASIASDLTQLYMLLAVSILGGTAAMVIILTRLFTHKISKPLRKITGFAQIIAAGGRCFRTVDSMLDESPKLIAIDEETNHQVVHMLCLGKADCPAYQPLDPRA